MSSNKIKDLANQLSIFAENKEKLATPILINKLSRSLQENPHDQTIGGILRILESMVKNNKNFIRKADLKDLYKKYYVNGTKCAQALESDLGDISHKTQVQKMDHSSAEDLDIYTGANEILSNALSSAFLGSETIKAYSEKVANAVLKTVQSSLSSWNLPANKVVVDAGNEKFIVARADYETPKGLTSFYVPVDVSGKHIQASVFVGNFGPSKLDNASIKKYITANAGSKLNLKASSILDVLVKSASKNEEMSQTELAVLNLKASREAKNEFYGNSILGQSLDAQPKMEVKVAQAASFSLFDEKLKTPAGTAAWKFGPDKLKIANDVLVRTLASFGFNNPKISIASNTEDTIFHAVSLNNGKIGFNVPVKIFAGKVNTPKVLICNGSLLPLEAKTLNKMATENLSDNRSSAVASPLFNLKPSDVLNNLRVAMSSGNLHAAEDALNVLANCGDEKAHAIGFNEYMSGLTNKTASKQTCCSKLVKKATSQHMICSHTGLPEHKVYQDEQGNCRPLYRKGMDESYEAASFINAKIFG